MNEEEEELTSLIDFNRLNFDLRRRTSTCDTRRTISSINKSTMFDCDV